MAFWLCQCTFALAMTPTTTRKKSAPRNFTNDWWVAGSFRPLPIPPLAAFSKRWTQNWPPATKCWWLPLPGRFPAAMTQWKCCWQIIRWIKWRFLTAKAPPWARAPSCWPPPGWLPTVAAGRNCWPKCRSWLPAAGALAPSTTWRIWPRAGASAAQRPPWPRPCGLNR